MPVKRRKLKTEEEVVLAEQRDNLSEAKSTKIRRKAAAPSAPEVEDTPPRRKKKRVNATPPVEEESDDSEEVEDSAKAKKLSQKARSTKRKATEEMAELEAEIAEKNPKFDETTYGKVYMSMFSRLKKIMRKVEKRAYEGGRSGDIYALMALYNQMREVIADCRQMLDMSHNTEQIIEGVVHPLVRDISNNYVDVIYHIRKMLRQYIVGKDYEDASRELQVLLREHAKYIQTVYDKSIETLEQMFSDED